jgi:hypothetical protein
MEHAEKSKEAGIPGEHRGQVSGEKCNWFSTADET